jgi:hypothetical protein
MAKSRSNSTAELGRLVVLRPEAVSKEMLDLMPQVILLTRAEQEAFWGALTRDQPLTTAQARLGRLMRGER